MVGFKTSLIILLALCLQDSADRAIEIAHVADRRISEASGIVASRHFPGVYWTHNDGGDNRLFAIHRDGSVIGFTNVDAKLHDWEDIAIDDAGNLYIADTGNNVGGRKHLVVCRVREPDPGRLGRKKTRTLAVQDLWKIQYPGEPFNCESLFVWRGVCYMIAKSAAGAKADLYRFDPALNDPTLQKISTLPIDQPVTAADISVDGKELAVLTHGAVWIFPISGDMSRAADVKPACISVPPGKVEGCCFGDGEILIVAESGEIFAAPQASSSTTKP